jgi:hypothetical protein
MNLRFCPRGQVRKKELDRCEFCKGILFFVVASEEIVVGYSNCPSVTSDVNVFRLVIVERFVENGFEAIGLAEIHDKNSDWFRGLVGLHRAEPFICVYYCPEFVSITT